MSSWYKSRCSAIHFYGTYFPERLINNCNSDKYICFGDSKAERRLYNLVLNTI